VVFQGDGAGIVVGPEVAASRADYRVADPDAVRVLLASFVSG
jgi:hypothetical protein